MLRAYGDESMDETKQRVCAVAAVTGADDDWQAVEQKWLARNNGIPFHAKDCDVNPGRGDYTERSHEENKALYRDLAIMLADSGLYGVGVAIDLEAQRKAFPDAPNFTYFRAFLQVIEFLKSHAQARAEIVEVTFDARTESDHNAAMLYTDFRADALEWKEHLASKISFKSDTDNPRIQIADLLARETMKALDNVVGPVKRPERKSWLTLHKTGRFGIFAYGEEFFQDMQRYIPEMNKELGFSEVTYFEWLGERRIQNNQTNLFKFLAEKTKGRDFSAALSKVQKKIT